MFKHDPQSDKPCPHMRSLVSALADDALSGLARWYTRQHVAGCPQCRNALTYYVTLKTRLGTIAAPLVPLPPDRWTAAEAAWEEADKEAEAVRVGPK
jgi:predicted anti-sigma-YlaC factor YlaD